MLLDSNIIIYTLEPSYDSVRQFIGKQKTIVSTAPRGQVRPQFGMS
uniref:Uncharacterized protein n=1 Tax=Candidatus Kentrum sp. LPFa TaxID=2126335 RepID=A0A450Y4Y9_9GAMM|nr:MAG: hypothetical protein BECKLPF1236A_GA0070988_106653 [Candidatus Kentron sp. LPFa]VFK28640.1 MAG: hypothetical protein BECKLPF1236A_GA0070988_106773 [Candidatus Kentron sp. LPFa]VFK36592.1 MAG: hypothetical protein BECKLPF1236C_GA0070990_106503 [Candidatus Kentron sp. LPFa]